ncbi:thioredoxin [Corynebacterium heidelbergense]|uniref:Thioredoxin n=1 Tax=Corynebacterium heidelbergense TaxID=2055947 RepID=A0A364V8I7_9CORY|nr:thioredoxin [Corynebacterium heidelbergense]RAV32876.1 thioredoxin [Corynebacterium heidelbergense]
MSSSDASTAIHSITHNEFHSEVVEAEVPVLVDFWAEWCQPCLHMNPVLEELAEELGSQAKIVKVNLDEERVLGAMFQVMSIPALFVFHGGKKTREFHGAQSKDTLKAALSAGPVE